MRCGRKIGTRDPMRMNSICSIELKRARIFSSLLSENMTGAFLRNADKVKSAIKDSERQDAVAETTSATSTH